VNRINDKQMLTARKHRPDYGIVLISSILMIIGIIVLFSIGPALQNSAGITVGKQFVAIVAGILAFIAASILPLSFWRKAQPVLIIMTAIASIALLFAPEINGAARWIPLGPFSFQPSELLKLTLIIYLANFLARRGRDEQINDASQTIIPIGILTGVMGVFIVFLQRDLGTMSVVIAIVFAMLYISGIKAKQLMAFLGGVVAAAVGSVLIAPHRMNRVLTFLDPGADVQGAGYHINQALIAVGSGGIFGLGLGHSVQAYGYLPESATDSIFAVYAEKFGFLGSLMILVIFGALLFRIAKIIENSPNLYTKLLATGVFAWFFGQVTVNVGAMLGLMPLTGITLPLLSFGGSSLVFSMAALGLVFNLSRYTKFESKRGANHAIRSDRRRNGRTRYANPTRSSLS
jgi:cell division protein FtsW